MIQGFSNDEEPFESRSNTMDLQIDEDFALSDDFTNMSLCGQPLCEKSFDDKSISLINPRGVVGNKTSFGSMSEMSNFSLSPSNPSVLDSNPQYPQVSYLDKMKSFKECFGSQSSLGSLTSNATSLDFSVKSSNSRTKRKKKKTTSTISDFSSFNE